MISIQSIDQGLYTKADWNNQFVLHVSSSAKPGDTPFYKPWGMCHPKGVCFFAPFWCRIGYGNNRGAWTY